MLSEKNLDLFTTITGLVGGGALLLGSSHLIPMTTATLIAGVAKAIEGFLTNKQPTQ